MTLRNGGFLFVLGSKRCYNTCMMQYTLLTKNGKVMQFFVKAVAELYQTIYGGVVITQQIFDVETV